MTTQEMIDALSRQIMEGALLNEDIILETAEGAYFDIVGTEVSPEKNLVIILEEL